VIRFSAALVAVAAVLLVAGIITSDLKLVYVAIGVSSVALLALAIGWFLNKDKLSASSLVAESMTGSASAVPEVSVPVAAGFAGSWAAGPEVAESVPSGLSAGGAAAGLGGVTAGSGSVASGRGNAPQAGAPWGPASGSPEHEAFTGSSSWPPAAADGTSWTGYAPAAPPVGYVPPAEPFAPFVPEPAAVGQRPDPDAAAGTAAPTEKTPVLPDSDAETPAETSAGTETSTGTETSAGTEPWEAERVEVEPLSADLVESAGGEEPSPSPEEGPEHADAQVDDLVEPAAGDTPADGTAPVDAPADDTPADEVAVADTAVADTTAEADSADGSLSAEAPADAAPEPPDPSREVTVVPGVPRYHDAGCILIRFMGEGDLEKKTLGAAAEAGCTPCRACLPD
jgi:hypothetical protein